MRFLLLLILGLVAPDLWSQTSYYPRTQLLHEKGYELAVGADYFRTSKAGDEKLESGEKFEKLDVQVGGQYAVTKGFQLGGGARFRQNRSSLMVGEEVIDASSSGLQSLVGTVAFGFDPVGNMLYGIEGYYRYVPYSYSEINNASTFNFENDLVLGDVGHDYGAGLLATYASPSHNFLTARAGWRKPGIDLSTEIYWQLEGALAWQSLALVAGVDGVSSLNNGMKEGRPVYNTGRTALFNSYNREWIAPYAGFNVALGKEWRAELRASQVVSGRQTDLGTGFGIQLVRRVENNPNKNVDTKFKAYDVEAAVTKVSPKKGFVVIDKGVAEDIAKGMKFDLYEFDYVGGNTLVARGVVIETKVETAIIKITQHYNLKKDIKTGLVARGRLK